MRRPGMGQRGAFAWPDGKITAWEFTSQGLLYTENGESRVVAWTAYFESEFQERVKAARRLIEENT